MIRSALILLLILATFPLRSVRAGEDAFAGAESDGFTKGAHEIEGLAALFFSLDRSEPRRPSMTTALAIGRSGWMLNNQRSGIFFGNEECLIEGFAGPIIHGPGSVMAGMTLMLRHNFVWGRNPIFVPYFQIGAGPVGSDAYEVRHQYAIGLPVEFNLQTSLGARWRVNRDWSINTEFGYRHISNAGVSSRNGGYDLGGGIIGLARTF